MMNDVLIPEQGWADVSLRMEIPTDKSQSILFKIVGKASKLFGREVVPDVFKILAINKRLFWSWLYFASKLMPYGKLPIREREMIILRVAWLCRCRYEWGQHIEVGLKNGLTAKDVVNISIGYQAFQEVKEKALIQTCDELIRNQQITEQTWQVLKTFYAEKLLIEITFLIGNYQMLAGFLNSVGLKLEDSTEMVMKQFNAAIQQD